jgi:hypothetical protein
MIHIMARDISMEVFMNNTHDSYHLKRVWLTLVCCYGSKSSLALRSIDTAIAHAARRQARRS